MRVTDYTKPITGKDLSPPAPDREGAKHLSRALTRHSVSQETAVDAVLVGGPSGSGHIRQAGRIVAVRVLLRVTAAGTETMDIDVRKNGVTVLSTPIALDATTPAGEWQSGVVLATAAAAVALGDLIDTDLAYTVGAGQAPVVGTLVEIDIES